MQFQRDRISKIQRKPGLDIYVCRLTLFPGEEDEEHYLEIREYMVEAEMFGHGILLPIRMADDIISGISNVTGAE